MALTITLQDSIIQTYLQQLQAKMGDLNPVMDSIGYALEQSVRRRFETRTDPSGEKWAAWKKSTDESYPRKGSKAAKGKSGPGMGRILERYGSMLNGLSYTFNANSATIGFDQPYATYHEWGTKKMDRRGLLTATPQTGTLGSADQQTVLEIVANYMQS